MSRSATAILPLLVGLVLAPRSTGAGAEPAGLDRCRAAFAAQPDAEAPAKCFLAAADAGDAAAREAAVVAVERLLAQRPGSPWLLYYLGSMRWREVARAAELFQESAEAFGAWGDGDGEFRARYNLANLFALSGQTGAVARERDLAIELARRSVDPRIRAQGAILEAKGLRAEMRDLERALAIVAAVEPAIFPGGSFALRKEWLLTAGGVALDLSRLDEATVYNRRLLDLARTEGTPYLEATALLNLMDCEWAELSLAPTPKARALLVELTRQALAVAAATRNADVESKAHLVLAMLSAGTEAREEGERCLAVAPSDQVRSYCRAEIARGLATSDPAAALRMIEEAIELADKSHDPWSRAFAWGVRMRVAWQAGTTSRAIEDSWAALDAIEVLRDLQSTAESRGQLFSLWTDDYLWFAGRLLQEYAAGGGDELLAIAHEVAERMRARALLDALQAAGAAPRADGATAGLQERLADSLTEGARARGRLLDPDLPPADRQAAKAELERLELEQARLRAQIDGVDPGLGDLRRPHFPPLAEVQRDLAADQALLSFVVAPHLDLGDDFGGDGWLVAVTRDAVRAYPSLDRTRLRPAVKLFTGLFEARDGREAEQAGSFARKLLSTALGDLPAGVDRLIVVPDDFLHLLPFTVLRDGSGAALVSRYQVTEVPSATLWLHWRRSRPTPAPVPALVLADPRLAGEGEEGSAATAGGAGSGAGRGGPPRRFERLLQSEPEGRAVVGYLRGGSELRLREDASEAFVKSADLRRFTVLHFATHAVTDDVDPSMSAVLLAPGTADEDGRLHIREIVDLDLEGRLVVLSSCRTASGVVVRGEGVMGLARAFFRAGAHAVLASLWPLEDADAALVFDRFYHHLAAGDSVAAALAAAQRDRIADGAPAAAWAGLVVLGDGDLVPVPGGVLSRPPAAHSATVAAVTLIFLVTGVGIAVFRRRAGSGA